MKSFFARLCTVLINLRALYLGLLAKLNVVNDKFLYFTKRLYIYIYIYEFPYR